MMLDHTTVNGTGASNIPLSITERQQLRGEVERNYYVSVMELVGREQYDEQFMNLFWRADATMPRDWSSEDQTKFADDPSLVCDLNEWR